LSASWNYFSASFTGSQIALGNKNQIGSYYADVFLPFNTTGLSGVLDREGKVSFKPVWKSLDGTVIFSTGSSVIMRQLNSSDSGVPQRNYALNITNLKENYLNKDVAKLRVFAYNFDPTIESFYLPYHATPKIFKQMYWSVIDPYTKEVLIPFDDVSNATQLSADGKGMYFNLYMEDLPINKPLEIKFLIKEYGSSLLIENQSFIFKVVNS
jgi:hypothetical protein